MHEENRNLEIILAGSQKTDTRTLPFDNQTIEDVVEKIPVLKTGYDITIDGRIISKGDWPTYFLYPEDKIIFVPNFGAGGIALAIMGLAAAPAVAFTATYIAYAALTMAISIGISLGVGYLIKSLTPSPKKAVESPSQAYSWEPKTTQQQGLVKPKIFGKFKSLGNIIAGHVSIKSGDKYKLVMNALVSHGTGPVKSVSDIRLNNQPESNFPGVVTDTRRGLLEQTPIAAFVPLKIQFRPNIDITNAGGPLVWEVPDDDYDDIELILRYVAYYFHKDGDRETQSVGTKIEIRELPAGGWETVFNEGVTNSNTKTFWKSFKMSTLEYDVIQGKKYEIRVTHTNGDYEPGYRKQRQMALEFVTEISDDALEYPGLVLVGISGALTDAFTGLHSTSCIIEGQIVYQYDDVAEEWILDWTDNPGWVAGYTLTQPVISGDGAGTPYAIEKLEGMQDARINWDDVKELVAHCDTECPDGKGGVESLITFNGSFDTTISTWNAALDVCKIARSVPIWKGNIVDFVIDKPTERTDVIAAGNIIDGSFDETFLPKKDRVSAIDVAYNDINSNYDRVFLRTFSSVLPESSNVLTLDFRGIVKKTEAWRLAKFHQAYNDHIHRTIKCKADIDALTYRLGDVLGVQWDATNWNKLKDIGQRGSGRIKAFTYDAGGDIVTLDYDIEDAFEDGNTYEILIRLRNDTQVLKTIASAEGGVVTIVGHYAEEPYLDDLWIVGLQNYVVKDFRLINRSRSKKISYELALLEYDEAIWANDALAPPITGLYTTPAKSDSGSVIEAPSHKNLESLVPEIAMGGGGAGGGLDGVSTSNIKFVTVPIGITWTERRPAGDSDESWYAVASDSDGSHLIVGEYNGRLYTSSDSGVSWTERQPAGDTNQTWKCVASDSDGSHLIAGAYNGRLYTSANGGIDWVERQPDGDANKGWRGVASDSDGSNLIAGAFNGRLCISDDYGASWVLKGAGGGDFWQSVASDSDGTNLMASTSQNLYTSANSGVDWTERQPAGAVQKDWECVASDADGSHLIAGVYGGRLYTSANYGVGWTERQPAGNNDIYWWSVSSNSDGSCLIVGIYNGRLYRTEDSGVSWDEERPAGDTNELYWAVASDSSGDNLIVAAYSGRVYTGVVIEGAIEWVAEDEETELLLNFLGDVYIIEPDSTTLKYIYWDSDTSETELQTTDDQSVVVAGDFSVLCFNKEGVPYAQ